MQSTNYGVFLILALHFSTALAQAPLPDLSDLDSGWNSIASGGLCSSGTPHQFYVLDNSESEDLLLYFAGGGACWFGEACDLRSDPNIHTPFATLRGDQPPAAGIFERDNQANPLAEYDMVFLPYCTGDVHVGAGTRVYSYQDAADQTVEVSTYHHGYENSQKVLDWVYRNFSDPSRVVISGSSAGAIGASFYAGFVAENYAAVPVVLLADAAGGYGPPDQALAHAAWDTAAVLPQWPHYRDKTNETISFEDFYIASTQHADNLTIAQYNAARDQVQVNFSLLLGDVPGGFSLTERMLNNYLEIESAVDAFYSFTAGGSTHTILASDYFYDYEVEGVLFRNWLEDLVNGRAVTDLSCVNEAAGCAEPSRRN